MCGRNLFHMTYVYYMMTRPNTISIYADLYRCVSNLVAALQYAFIQMRYLFYITAKLPNYRVVLSKFIKTKDNFRFYYADPYMSWSVEFLCMHSSCDSHVPST